MAPLRLDAEFILLGLCSSPRIITGGMSTADIEHRDGGYGWHAPLEFSAAYHFDHHVARDVALSWLSLHDGLRIAYKIAGLPLDELAARVEAAPKGTKIGLARSSNVVFHHAWADFDLDPPPARERLPIELWERGPREIFPEDDLLSREQVLAVLQTPPEELLTALEKGGVLMMTHFYRTLWPLWSDALRLLGIRP